MVKLMIVDDSNLIRSRIARVCNDPRLAKLQVIALAKNGKEALSFAYKHKPDCVTLDITMPEMDGDACLQELLKITPHARVLIISALSDKATALKLLTKGAIGFLHKPFTDRSLSDALLELLS